MIQRLRLRLSGRSLQHQRFRFATILSPMTASLRRGVFPGPNHLIAFAELARRAATPGAINSCPSAVQRPLLLGNKAIDSSRPRGPLVSRYATRWPTTSSEKSLWEIDIRPGFLIRKCRLEICRPRYQFSVSARSPSRTQHRGCFSSLPRHYLRKFRRNVRNQRCNLFHRIDDRII